MNKKELRAVIKQLIQDRDCNNCVRWAMAHVRRNKDTDCKKLWVDIAENELARTRDKKKEYNKIINNLIKKYNDQ